MKFWTARFFNLTVVGDFGYVLSASHIATGGEDTRIRISIAPSGGVWIFRWDIHIYDSFIYLFDVFMAACKGKVLMCAEGHWEVMCMIQVCMLAWCWWGGSISSGCDYWLFMAFSGGASQLSWCDMQAWLLHVWIPPVKFPALYGLWSMFTMFGSGMEVERARVFLNWGGCLSILRIMCKL